MPQAVKYSSVEMPVELVAYLFITRENALLQYRDDKGVHPAVLVGPHVTGPDYPPSVVVGGQGYTVTVVTFSDAQSAIEAEKESWAENGLGPFPALLPRSRQ